MPSGQVAKNRDFSKNGDAGAFSTDGEFLEKPEKPAYTPGHLLP